MTSKAKLWDEVERVPIEDVKPHPNNPKEHPEEQINKLIASISEYDWDVPIVVDKDLVIIKGHGRLKAAQKMDLEEVPVIVRDDLTKAEAKAARIADNKTAESAWDDDLLATTLDELQEMDEDLPTGFTDDEVDQLLAEMEEHDIEEDDFNPEPRENPVTEKGEVWELGNHRLLVGDGLDTDNVQAVLQDEQAQMVLTDPPYNVAYNQKGGNNPQGWSDRDGITNDDMTDTEWQDFCEQTATIIDEHSTGEVYVFHAPGPDGRIMACALDKRMHWSSTVIWRKQHFVFGRATFQRKYEPIWFGWPEDHDRFHKEDRSESDVWDFDRPVHSEEHPTMKPIELCAHAIEFSSRPGDTVLDPFGGSGSTLIAAEQTDRKARLVELEPKYADVIIERWQELTGKNAVRDGDGTTYADLKAQEDGGEG